MSFELAFLEEALAEKAALDAGQERVIRETVEALSGFAGTIAEGETA